MPKEINPQLDSLILQNDKNNKKADVNAQANVLQNKKVENAVNDKGDATVDAVNNLKPAIEDYMNPKEFSMYMMKTLKGDKGEQGIKGDSVKGDKGAQGIKGEKGDKGEQGIQGVKGEKGDIGKQGVDGLDGIDGVDGKDGKDGVDGKEVMKEIKGEDIVNKIEELEKDNRLSYNSLKDTPTLYKKGKKGGVASKDAESPLTTKGDVYVFGSKDNRLPVGSNGQAILADSSKPLGIKWGTTGGGGDMSASTYDPTSVEGDAFDMDNMVEGTNKILTSAERTILGNTSGTNTGDMSNADVKTAYELNADTNAFTDAEKTLLGNQSGVNTGDQDLSGKQDVLSEGAFVDGDKTKLDGIESSADVTDTANVTSAGALMDSEITNLAQIKAFDSSDYAPALGVDDNYVTDAEKTVIGNTSGTNTGDEASASTTVSGISELATIAEIDTGTDTGRTITPSGLAGSALQTKVDGIEASADVTDTTNVTLAGALMDSEVTNLADVKAFDTTDYATSAQGSTADSALQDVADDTTPQLGGNLDVNGNQIVSTSNGDIVLAPNGTGIVKGELKRFMVQLLASDTDQTTDTTIGGDYRISNRAITIKAVGAYVDTAGVTGTCVLDINEAGTSILSTKITIDSTEKSSETAAIAPVISDSSIAADAIITFDIDTIHSGTAAKGVKIWIDYIYT